MTLKDNCIEQTKWFGAVKDWRAYLPHVPDDGPVYPATDAESTLLRPTSCRCVYQMIRDGNVVGYARLDGNARREWGRTMDGLSD